MPSAKTILIAGCSSPQGIGFASARALADRGHVVHATVRHHEHDESLVAGYEQLLRVHELDLLDRASISAVVTAITENGEPIDVLVNNAAYGLIGGVEQVDLARARASFDTDFFGTMAVIQEVLPVMRRHRGGHIVNLSTVFAAAVCPPGIGYYVASKAALETVSQALAVEAAPWGVRVTNFQPGPVMTELSREWGDRLSGEEDPRPALSDELYDWVLGAEAPAAQSPSEVAAALVEIIDSPAPGLAAQSGPAAEQYVVGALREPTREHELARLLAAFSRTWAAHGETI